MGLLVLGRVVVWTQNCSFCITPLIFSSTPFLLIKYASLLRICLLMSKCVNTGIETESRLVQIGEELSDIARRGWEQIKQESSGYHFI